MMIELPELPEPDPLCPPTGWVRFTADQMQEHARQAVAAAMERAAQIAESDEFYGTVTPVAIAAAIRAEMSKEPQ